MNLTNIKEVVHVSEPDLLFADGGRCVDQKIGLSIFGPLEASNEGKSPRRISLGIIGSKKTIDLSLNLFTGMRGKIPPPSRKQFMPIFPGFTIESTLRCTLDLSSDLIEIITRGELSELSKQKEFKDKVSYVLQILFEKMRNLSERTPRPDIIVVAIPSEIDKQCTQYWDRFGRPLIRKKRRIRKEWTINKSKEYSSLWEAEMDVAEDIHFSSIYRAIKTEAMKLEIPTQVIRAETLQKKGVEDDCTIAWNLAVATYYKSGGYPWRLADTSHGTCFVGISFYKSIDDYEMRSSIAQVFSPMGEGLVLRGDKAEKTQSDKSPRLDAAATRKLMHKVVSTYKRHMKVKPTRIVVHKSSIFSDDEIDGIESSLKGIHAWDIISLDYSYLRLFRAGKAPPLRGTYIVTSDNRCHLYTRGYVPFHGMYWGPSTPRPLVITQHLGDTPTREICKEILGLTKMNWNSSAFSMREPITLGFARKVGSILSDAETKTEPKTRYLYYM